MFIFRGITLSDIKLTFSTGDKTFNEINPDGTLTPYIKGDIIEGGLYQTYILIREEENNTEVCAILRYCFKEFNELKTEIQDCSDMKISIKEIEKICKKENFQIVYLSRVGISERKQNKHLSQVVLNFFDLFMFELERNILIYSKVREGFNKFLGPLYKTVASNQDDQWGRYSIFIRLIKRV